MLNIWSWKFEPLLILTMVHFKKHLEGLPSSCPWVEFVSSFFVSPYSKFLKITCWSHHAAYHGAKVVNFHGDLPYTTLNIIKKMDLLDERDMIGSGGFGTVYRLVMDDGKIYAVKRIGVFGLSSDRVFERELEILGSFKHRNLVNLRGYCNSPTAKLLIYDYLPCGNLEEFLHGLCPTSEFALIFSSAMLRGFKNLDWEERHICFWIEISYLIFK